jgi:DNA-binding NtrC family response regulator
VLVIASRRDMRVRVRDAIRHLGLAVDMVSSIDEATEFCRDGLPHAIIVEGILSGERLKQLRAEIHAEVPDFPFIEIIEEGASFAMSGFGGAAMGRVGRDAIESALPSVLMFELSRSL